MNKKVSIVVGPLSIRMWLINIAIYKLLYYIKKQG